MTSWIKLTVPEKLDAAHRKQWYKCVQTHTPSGLLHHTTLPDSEGVHTSSYYHKPLSNGNHSYVIPLVRDLVHHEVYQLANSWDQTFDKINFAIDYSQPADHTQPASPDVPAHKIAQVMDAWCKKQHSEWMQDKITQGWRYGIKVSMKDKTHPWMQPWESLPEQARSSHMQSVKDLLHILGEFGYTIIQRPES